MTATLDDATLDGFMAAGCALLGIATEPDWHGSIRANLRVAFALAAVVGEVALADAAEPAPVFVA